MPHSLPILIYLLVQSVIAVTVASYMQPHKPSDSSYAPSLRAAVTVFVMACMLLVISLATHSAGMHFATPSLLYSTAGAFAWFFSLVVYHYHEQATAAQLNSQYTLLQGQNVELSRSKDAVVDLRLRNDTLRAHSIDLKARNDELAVQCDTLRLTCTQLQADNEGWRSDYEMLRRSHEDTTALLDQLRTPEPKVKTERKTAARTKKPKKGA